MKESLVNFRQKEYPGRLIILGKDPSGQNIVAVYAITGRSPASQARKLVLKGDTIWTEATEEKLLSSGKIELLLYPALFLSQGIAISNGQQTEDIKQSLDLDKTPLQILSTALAGWSYENDPPIYTPRISGCLVSTERAALSIIKRNENGNAVKNIFEFPLIPGKGRLISTYQGDNKEPLLSFSGEPEPIEVKAENTRDLARSVYQALEPKPGQRDFRVAVASVFFSNLRANKYDVFIINRMKGS